jgi:predicted GNAT family acetyltransferase
MKVENPMDTETFLQKTQIILDKDEVCSSQIYGLTNTLIKNKHSYGNTDPFYSVVYNNEVIKIIGLMALPSDLNIYQNENYDHSSMDLFIENIFYNYKNISGIKGEINLVEAFKQKWMDKTKCKSVLHMNLRLFKLEKVNEYQRPEGIFRRAVINDIEILKKYAVELFKQTNEKINDYDNFFEGLKNNIEDEILYVWEDKTIVSMARKVRPTKNGMAINFVYTSKEYRSRGYGTAIVSELSKNILGSGKKFCTLFTDLSNPISNNIYKKIGYKKVCDHIHYAFK